MPLPANAAPSCISDLLHFFLFPIPTHGVIDCWHPVTVSLGDVVPRQPYILTQTCEHCVSEIAHAVYPLLFLYLPLIVWSEYQSLWRQRGKTQTGKGDHTKVLKLRLVSLLVKNETALALNITITKHSRCCQDRKAISQLSSRSCLLLLQ